MPVKRPLALYIGVPYLPGLNFTGFGIIRVAPSR
jgi:hypothetical protein